jgi:hypothetical protein
MKLSNGSNYKRIIHALENVNNAGYHISHRFINANEHGIPHNREKWYCVGTRKCTTKNKGSTGAHDDALDSPFEFPIRVPFFSVVWYTVLVCIYESMGNVVSRIVDVLEGVDNPLVIASITQFHKGFQ